MILSFVSEIMPNFTRCLFSECFQVVYYDLGSQYLHLVLDILLELWVTASSFRTWLFSLRRP